MYLQHEDDGGDEVPHGQHLADDVGGDVEGEVGNYLRNRFAATRCSDLQIPMRHRWQGSVGHLGSSEVSFVCLAESLAQRGEEVPFQEVVVHDLHAGVGGKPLGHQSSHLRILRTRKTECDKKRIPE